MSRAEREHEKPPRPCVILYRNPGAKTLVVGVIRTIDDGTVLVFKDKAGAEAFVRHNTLCQAWPTQIVPLDELLMNPYEPI